MVISSLKDIGPEALLRNLRFELRPLPSTARLRAREVELQEPCQANAREAAYGSVVQIDSVYIYVCVYI